MRLEKRKKANQRITGMPKQLKLPKKGFAFTSFLVVITLLLLASVVTIVLMKQNKFQFQQLGKIQLNTIQTYQTAEKTLFTIDQAAKYSLYQTTFELAENGGLYNPSSGCGDYLEYAIWHDRGKDCYPANERRKKNYARIDIRTKK